MKPAGVQLARAIVPPLRTTRSISLAERWWSGANITPNGEVRLALGVAPHVAGEPIGRQPLPRLVVHHPLQRRQVRPVEPEVLDGVEHASHPGHHAVPAPLRQTPGKQLEDRAAMSVPATQSPLDHGQLVRGR